VRTGRTAAWGVLAIALLLSLGFVLTPMGLIQPFRAQTDAGVHLSYVLRSWSPSLTLLLAIAGGLAAALLMRRPARWYGRTGAVLLALSLLLSAWLARQNHFEWMFHPIDEPRFAGTDGGHGLADDDLVLGVTVGDAARAYPVKALAYHHVVNDEVGERALVATY
jgi:uncharacterized protein DUF3179